MNFENYELWLKEQDDGLQWPTRPIRQSCNFDDEQKLQAFIKVVVQRLTQPLQQPMDEVLQRLEKTQAGGDRKEVARFVNGLRPELSDLMEVYTFWNVSAVVSTV
ncbi:hypothetical protein WN944_022652 [Citrus x changshan-huyou]|uniref:Uncharacterized protein n=1 Tax=Citrus x changshan-huyou TaxID=2935761 RepID=A0AAP0N163_9ROSI